MSSTSHFQISLKYKLILRCLVKNQNVNIVYSTSNDNESGTCIKFPKTENISHLQNQS